MKLTKQTYEFDCEALMRDVRMIARLETNKEPSLRDIAAKCGVSSSTLSRLDNGAIPDMDILIRLLDTFNLSAGKYFLRIEWKGEIQVTESET